MNLQIGDQFQHYQVTGLLTQGGMSTIYRVVDLLNSQEMVLKIPDEKSMSDPAQAERFQRELEVTKTLSHPAIQKGRESGVYDRTPYLVTDLVEGQSLRELIQARGQLPTPEALDLFSKIASGAAYLHQNGVFHRDLKPENIIVKPDNQPVILDFGMALTRNARRVTFATTSSGGTPDYMAPEQIEGQRGDARTDQYALGTILFELLAGKPPFSGDNHMAVMAQHLNGAIPRVDKMPGVDCSPQLAAVVMRMLQRNPAARYPSIEATLADLQNLDRVSTGILDAADAGAQTLPPTRADARRGVLIAAAVGVAVLIVLALVVFTQMPR
jgi:serine/threonine-protein kinase